MSKKFTENTNVFTMNVTTLSARCDEVRDLLEKVHALLPGLIHMPSEDRRTSDGKYREGESAALSAVLALAKSQPGLLATGAVLAGARHAGRRERLAAPRETGLHTRITVNAYTRGQHFEGAAPVFEDKRLSSGSMR
jgi:hypothetical protein